MKVPVARAQRGVTRSPPLMRPLRLISTNTLPPMPFAFVITLHPPSGRRLALTGSSNGRP